MSARDATFLETADRLGARLCRDALWSGQRCNWLGWALDVVGRSYSRVYRAQTGALYDGTAGIALYLGRLHAITGESTQRATALGALNQALASVSRMPKPTRASLYSGATGVAYTAIELGTLFEDERLIARGRDELERATADVDDDAWLDVLGGSAGAIQTLLTMAACHALPASVEIADVHGRRLLQKARRSDRGWSWDTLPGQSSDHLLGYGHGAAGIACALLELSVATTNEEYRHAALEAFRYERSFFSQEHHNWPDLRAPATPPQQAVYAVAWCHGGPGIGLSRLRAVQLIADEGVERDLEEALQLTVGVCGATGSPAGADLSLCHGVGGNADLLIEAATIRNRPELLECAERAGRQAIETYVPDDLPWPCGVTSGGETPNLMLGLAGIGHFFLRLHDPHRVPSINLVKPAYDVARAGALVSASEGAGESAVWS